MAANSGGAFERLKSVWNGTSATVTPEQQVQRPAMHRRI